MPQRIPIQERGLARREALLDAAADILQRDGLARLNTSRIAAEAGCSVGALYGYFQNKEDVLRALIARYGERLLQALSSSIAGLGQPESWEDVALQAFDAFVDFYTREPGYKSLWIGAAWSPDLVQAGEQWGVAFQEPLGAAIRAANPELSDAEAARVGQVAITLVSSLVTQALERDDRELIDEARLALMAYLRERLPA